MKDDEFYKFLDDEDQPKNDAEKIALENAILRSKLESKEQQKVYIVRGGQICVCHKSQFSIKSNTDGTRDLEVKGARMVVYGEDGIKRTI